MVPLFCTVVPESSKQDEVIILTSSFASIDIEDRDSICGDDGDDDLESSLFAVA
jgi:hypothetical protein